MFDKILNQNQIYINRWLISYADFVTLLLAIFMVMYALSQMDINYLKNFSESVGSAFSTQTKEDLSKIFSTTTTSVAFSLMEEDIKGEVAQFENIENIFKEKLNKITGVSISREPRGLLVRLNDGVLFDTGSDIIKAESIVLLDKIAEALKDAPNSIRIEGHTDNVPIKTSKFPSNWELSTSRATNIIRYLVKQHKIPPDKLSAIGYGEYMPISDNGSLQGRNLNRRVDIVVLNSAYSME